MSVMVDEACQKLQGHDTSDHAVFANFGKLLVCDGVRCATSLQRRGVGPGDSQEFRPGLMGDRLTFACRLTLPLACETLDRAPPAAHREAARWSNVGIIRFLLHEIDVNAALRPAEERLTEALAPIHAKLDMIIEVLGRLAYRDLALPSPREVELSLDRIAWHAPKAIKIGDWVSIKLFFNTSFLETVALYAQVRFCGERGEAGHPVQAELDEMSEASGEAFARLAFLAQRRQRGEQLHPTPARQLA